MFGLRILLILLMITGFSKIIHSQKMPADANKLYEDFTAAIVSRDTIQFSDVLTTAAYIKLRNEAISIGMNFPSEVFDAFTSSMLELNQLKYLNYKRDGATINAHYMYSTNNVPQNIVTLWMEEDKGKLKLREIRTRDAKDFITNLSRKDYSFLDLIEFTPTGEVEEVPQMITKIDYAAKYDIFGYGYDIDITINGFKHRGVKSSTTSGIVIGGIKKGENTIEFSLLQTDFNEQENPVIGIRAYIGEKEVQVFYFAEKETGIFKQTLTVE